MKSISCFILLCFFSIAYGQFSAPKFGKIDMLEMTMTQYDKDTTADALTLFDDGTAEFVMSSERRFQYVFKRHCRIKIFKKSAFDIADKSIRLYKNGMSKETLRNLNAVTYNLVDGKIVKTKLSSDKIYEEEGRNYIDKKFAFPDVKEGSVIEFSYNITSDFLYNFQGWVFQRKYPALWSQYCFTIPEYFDYRQSSKGYLPFNVNKTESGRTSYTLHYEAEITPGAGGGRTSAEDYKIEANITTKTIAVKDVPAFKSEPNIDCEDNYTQEIEFELSSIQYPHQIRQDYTKSWESVNTELNDDEDFGKLLKSNGFINDTVEMLCSNLTSKNEKAFKIYNYVQKRMKWDGYYRIWANRGLKKPFNERVGSSSEINLLLTLMLQTAGLNANPVLFSTRDYGSKFTYFPTITKFNSVLVRVEIDGKVYLLDAISNYCPFGILPANNINGRGRVVNNTNGEWVDLSANEKYRTVKQYNMEISSDGKFKGTIINNYDGYAGIEYRAKLGKEKSVDDYMSKLQENLVGLTINKYSISGRNNYFKPVTDSLSVEISDRADLIGDKIIFYPLLFERVEKNRYTLEERKFPVDYNFPIAETYIFDYTIPAGYQVESVPQATAIRLPDNSISITYAPQVAENNIKLVYRRNINKMLFLPEEYANLKEIYDQLVKKHAEQIILKKTI